MLTPRPKFHPVSLYDQPKGNVMKRDDTENTDDGHNRQNGKADAQKQLIFFLYLPSFYHYVLFASFFPIFLLSFILPSFLSVVTPYFL